MTCTTGYKTFIFLGIGHQETLMNFYYEKLNTWEWHSTNYPLMN